MGATGLAITTSRSALPEPATADFGGDRRDDRVEVADHRVVGDVHDRRLGIRVDREDVLRRLAADDVLDRAADPASDVEVRRDAQPGLADLVGMGPPAQARHDSRPADGAAEQAGELLEPREAL